MSIILAAATATTAATPFWQSSAGGIILGGCITLVTTTSVQIFAERRAVRRDVQASASAARARRIALQIDTITELQEELEVMAAFIGNAIASTTLDRLRTKASEYRSGMISFGRIGLLCTRLEDDALKLRIREWLRSVREFANTSATGSMRDEKVIELREQRIGIVDDLGSLLKKLHQTGDA